MKLTITIDLESPLWLELDAAGLPDRIATQASRAVRQALSTPCDPSGCTGSVTVGARREASASWRVEQ